jgi:hypothetical protein
MRRHGEASVEATVSVSADRPWLFGGSRGADPREAGRRGGVQSGRSRRGELEPDKLARMLVRLGGVQGVYGVYRNQVRLAEREQARLADLERRVAAEDMLLCGLLDQSDAERTTIARLRVRRREYEQAVTERIEALEQREAELRQRLESDDGLVAWLTELGEERVERAAAALGWIEDPDVVEA